MKFHRYSNVVYHEYCSCLRSSFGAVHTYMYIHCAFPASFVVQCTSDRTNVCVYACVYLRKAKENERTPRASYVSHQNARELRTAVIRYCDKSSNQVSFFLPFFSDAFMKHQRQTKKAINLLKRVYIRKERQNVCLINNSP